MDEAINHNKYTISDIFNSIADGWKLFRAIPGVSMAYSSIFAVIGLILLSIVATLGISPMALPFAGGFMLVGPILLSGFFKIADQYQNDQQSVRFSDAVFALKNAPRQLWIISLICSLLFLIWITDAAILYVIMIGGDEHMPYVFPWTIDFSSDVLEFEFWGAVMGSVMAFAIFSISAFSVPLLYQKRAKLTAAVSLSVKTIFSNFLTSLSWGILLSVLMIISILLLPVFLIALPVLAFASYSLYEKVFPVAEEV